MVATPEQIRDALDRTTDQTSFIQKLLVETLEWNIPAEATSIEKLGYDWYLDDDLGFTEDDRRNLSGVEIIQVPISRDADLFGDVVSDKWGVFIIPFKGAKFLQRGRGLISPLRKMLRSLMRQKASLPSFKCENILFICADPSFANVTFARFRKVKDKSVPPLTTFGWSSEDKAAFRTLCEHNLPNLHWEGDWSKAFEIERVTKAFYKDIFDWFETARPLVKFPLKVAARVLGRSESDLNSEAVIRLVIRMIFIWFMKEKRGLVPETLFDKATVQDFLRTPIGGDGHKYYNTILQNLFFATLNCPQTSRRFRKDKEVPGSEADRGISIYYQFIDDMDDFEGLADLFKAVPFLNGGLFTCHDDIQKIATGGKTENYCLDGFSEDSNVRAIVPDKLFFHQDGRSGLLDILKRYHFTIEEHTPLEQEVALDPELLGHVFENLLATYNPETKQTARKKTGSYYTPRSIVDYMVSESLCHYLSKRMKWSNDDNNQARLRSLLDYGQEGNPFDESTSSDLRTALYNIRIFDPACGSGAFPMGALQMLNHVLEKLNAEENRYERKLAMISQSIYGTDIQPIATEITTQRFFISLLIDQEVDLDKPNCGIEPLPNLEVKFMTANTLQSLNWRSIKGGAGQGDMFFHGVREQVDAIKTIFGEYLKATTAKDKEQIRGYFVNAKKTLLQEFAHVHIPDAERKLFEEWEPFGFSRSAGFFDPELMFGLPRPDGFDIVIGNPPYVRQEDIRELKLALKEEFGEFFKGTADLYTYFYKKGIELLKPGGLLAFITPNKFMSTAYGDNTRRLLTEEAHPVVLIDFNELPVFEATTYPLIALIEKGPPASNAEFVSLPEKELAKSDLADPATAVRKYAFRQPVSTLRPEKWLFEEPEVLALLEKLRATSIPLGKYVNYKIFYGVKTGLNEAFVINTDTRQRLIEEDPRSAEVIKPWLRGRDIRKWFEDESGLFIINIQSSTNKNWSWSDRLDAEFVFKKEYPAIHQHLTSDPILFERIKSRADQGRYWWELRACAYNEAFSEPKLVWGDIAQHFRAIYDTSGALVGNTAYIMPVKDTHLLSILHSKVIDWFVNKTLPAIMGKSYRFIYQNIVNLPVPATDKEQHMLLTSLANQILDLKSVLPDADIRELERKIDRIIFSLFKLTPAEIDLIEGENS